MLNNVLTPLMSGIDEGALLLLITAGLSLTFGTMRILNMAHGGLFMLGAYLTASFTGALGSSEPGYVSSVILSTVTVALIGLVLEQALFRRLYGRDPLSTLLLTFALLLAIQGLVQTAWGTAPMFVSLAPALVGHVDVGGALIPTLDLITIAVALLAMLGLAAFLYRTRVGLDARGIALDRVMAAYLGVNVNRTFALTFAFGAGLAGLAGALVAPSVQIDSTLGLDYIIQAFAVLLVGGLGTIRGTVVASLGLGILDAFVANYFPAAAGYDLYIAMAVVLVLKPRGLFGNAVDVTI